MKRNGLLFIITIIAVFSFLSAFADEKQINPQGLVGEWQGEWATAATRDTLYVTFKSLNEKKAGTLYIKGPANYHNRDLPFSLKLTLDDGKVVALTMFNDYVTVTCDDVSATILRCKGMGTRVASIILFKSKK